MRYRRSRHACIPGVSRLVVVSVILSTVPLAAQEPARLTWDNVLKLRTGERIVVMTESSKFPGSVQRSDPDSLAMVTTDKRELLLPRDKVKSVRYEGRHAKLGWGLVAAGIVVTAAAGAIDTGRDLSALSSGNLPKNHSYVGTFLGLGIATGGAILVLKGGAKTIYQRPEKPNNSPAK